MRQTQLGKSTYKGMNQDLSKKSPARQEFYYEGRNITILFNKETGNNVVQNEQGTKLVVTVPNIFVSNTTDSVHKDTQSGTSHIIFTEDDLPANHVGKFVTTYDNGTSFIYNPNTYNANIIQYSYLTNSEPLADTLRKDNEIVGACYIRDELILFCTDGSSGDSIWKVTYNSQLEATITCLWIGDINLSKTHAIKAIGNYESEAIKKVYWTDGVESGNQMRVFNTGASSPHNAYGSGFDFAPEVDFVQPGIIGMHPGGKFTKGIAQYAYCLYNKYGSRSKMSPMSVGVPTKLGKRGLIDSDDNGDLIEFEINGIDQRFDSIQVYRLFYTNTSGTPSVNLIREQDIDGTRLVVMDNGADTLGTISFDEFSVIGSDPVYANTFETKDNILFAGNFKEYQFDLDDFDTRAYGCARSSSGIKIADIEGNIYTVNGSTFQITAENGGSVTAYDIPADHDCIGLGTIPYQVDNSGTVTSRYEWASGSYADSGAVSPASMSLYQYKISSTTFGASGPNISLEWTTETISRSVYDEHQNYNFRSYKTGEVYRFGIQFYNKWGQKSFVKWIGDFRCPEIGDLNGNQDRSSRNLMNGDYPEASYPIFTVNNLDQLDDDIVGYQIVRMERGEGDKEVHSQGLVNPMIFTGSIGDTTVNNQFQISPILRSSLGSGYVKGRFTHGEDLGLVSETFRSGMYTVRGDFCNFYSPRIHFGSSNRLPEDMFLRHFGQAEVNQVITTMNEHSTSGSYEVTDKKNVTLDGSGYEKRAGSGYGTLYTTIHFDANNDYRWGSRPRCISWNFDTVKMNGSSTNYHIDSPLLSGFNMASYASLETDVVEDAADDQNFVNRSYIEDTDAFPIGSKFRWVYGLGSRTLAMRIWGWSGSAPADTWDNYAGTGIGFGVGSAISSTAKTYMYIAELRRIVQSRYGGLSFEARRANAYIPCGVYQDFGSSTSVTETVRNGDTFISKFRFMRVRYHNSNANIVDHDADGIPVKSSSVGEDPISYQEWVSVPVETELNLARRSDASAGRDSITQFDPNVDNYERYEDLYHREMNAVLSYAQPSTFVNVEDFDILTRYSDTKFINENIDSWTFFRPNNFKECDSQIGAITGFYKFQDNIYVTQESGVGIWSINPTAVVSTGSGPTVLGTGATLQKYTVISNHHGTQHRFGAIVGKMGIYVVDTQDAKIFNIVKNPDAPISDLTGMYSVFQEKMPPKSVSTDRGPLRQKGVMCGYDPNTYNAYFTIYSSTPVYDTDPESPNYGEYQEDIDNSFTISYNELSGSFVSMHDYLLSYSFSDTGNMFSVGSTEEGKTYSLYAHNRGDYGNYYGTVYDSYLTYLMSPYPDINKIMYNLQYRLEVFQDDTPLHDLNMYSYRMWNEYQDTGTLLLDPTVSRPNSHKHQREWRTKIARDSLSTNNLARMTNNWQFLTFTIDNALYNGTSLRYLLHDLFYTFNFARF